MKKGVLCTLAIFVVLLLFTGVVVIQSTGIFKNKESSTVSTDTTQPTGTTSSPPGTSPQSSGTPGTKDLTNTTIIPFLEKLTTRYPVLLQLGRQMGFNKQSASNMIQNYGDDNFIRTYLLILSKVLNL